MIRVLFRFVLKRNILLKLFSFLALSFIVPVSLANASEPAIVFNQAGYLTEWPKRALLINKPQISIVTLRDAESDALIMMIKPKELGFSDLDSTEVEGQVLDFSNIDREDEVKVELDWMLRMQRADGAIYRKLSGAKWPKVISPEADTQPRFIYGVSSPETGKFISSMAIAYRAYKDIDNDLANTSKYKLQRLMWQTIALFGALIK